MALVSTIRRLRGDDPGCEQVLDLVAGLLLDPAVDPHAARPSGSAAKSTSSNPAPNRVLLDGRGTPAATGTPSGPTGRWRPTARRPSAGGVEPAEVAGRERLRLGRPAGAAPSPSGRGWCPCAPVAVIARAAWTLYGEKNRLPGSSRSCAVQVEGEPVVRRRRPPACRPTRAAAGRSVVRGRGSAAAGEGDQQDRDGGAHGGPPGGRGGRVGPQ